MDFFSEHKKQIITVATLLLLILALATANKTANIPIIGNAISFVVTPLQKGVTVISHWVEDKTSYFRDNHNLAVENAELKNTIAELEAINKRLSLYEKENQKLSALLEISQKYAAYETTGTMIIAKDPGSWYDIFTIDKGKNDGITTNTVLTASGGLVGKVIESNSTNAKAQSILDNRSSVSAVSLRTSDRGVVRGDYTLTESGLCIMEYIDASAEIIEGDEIVTSSLSDIYPPGISIGYVQEIKYDSNGLTKYAIIKPHVDFKHLDTVLAIQNSSAALPVEEE